jgi:hypothetical protein
LVDKLAEEGKEKKRWGKERPYIDEGSVLLVALKEFKQLRELCLLHYDILIHAIL